MPSAARSESVPPIAPTMRTGGPASQAQLCSPWGIAFDKGQSQLFIADQGNARVMRMVIAH